MVSNRGISELQYANYMRQTKSIQSRMTEYAQREMREAVNRYLDSFSTCQSEPTRQQYIQHQLRRQI